MDARPILVLPPFLRPSRHQAILRQYHRQFIDSSDYMVQNLGPRQAREIAAPCRGSLAEPLWMTTGWTLLSSSAPFARDFLMSAPSAALTACLRTELRHDAAYALQARLLDILADTDGLKITRASPRFWTPHSGRHFMPSSIAALGIQKSDRDFLEGWSAKGNDNNTRTAQHKIQNMQRPVRRKIRSSPQRDPLGEAETVTQLKQYLSSRKVPTAVISQTLEKWSDTDILFKRHRTNSSSWSRHNFDRRPLPLDDDQTIRENNAAFSEQVLPLGFYIAPSSKLSRRTLHKLASCYRVPGTDNSVCILWSNTAGGISQCDTTCKNCTTLTKLQNRADSNASDASSSPGEST